MNPHIDPQPVNLGRYVAWFVGFYVGLGLLLGLLMAYFELPTNAGVSAGLLVAAAVFVGGKFIKDHKRLFTTAERWRITLYSFAVTVIMIALGVATFLIGRYQLAGATGDFAAVLAKLDKSAIVALLVGVGVILLISFALLYVGYGFLQRLLFKQMQKRFGAKIS